MEKNRHSTQFQSPIVRGIALCLCLAFLLSGCASTVVQIRPPYPKKVRPGDGVKITMKNGITHSGRVTYVDRAIVVLRTPRQTISDNPVKKAKYASTILWSDVNYIKVAGTLDSEGQFISNEEIRVNRRTSLYRKLPVNIGLLGTVVSFLAGLQFQDSISPPSTDPAFSRHNRARMAFWATWIGGSMASLLIGYRLGVHMDRKVTIARIEHKRREFRNAQFDSLMSRMIPRPDSTGTH